MCTCKWRKAVSCDSNISDNLSSKITSDENMSYPQLVPVTIIKIPTYRTRGFVHWFLFQTLKYCNWNIFNSLWPSDAIWRQRSGSWRHMATEVWVNTGSGNGLLPDGSWLILGKVQWHSSDGSFIRDTSAITLNVAWKSLIQNLKSPRGQWVKMR